MDAELTIRAATQADLPAIQHIEQLSFSSPWSETNFQHHLDAPAFFVAERHQNVLGYVLGDQPPQFGDAAGHIKNFAVAPDNRNQGIGTRLLTRALVALSVAGAQTVSLEVRRSNTGAQRLYRRIGFSTAGVDQDYYPDGEDAVVMVWRITSLPDQP